MSDDLTASIVVVGVGNILRRDEGIGVRAIQRLQESYTLPDTITLVDGGTMGLELISYIESAPHLLFVDAMLTDGPPGTLMRLPHEQIPVYFGMKASPHEIGLPDLLAVSRLRGTEPEEIVALGLHPETIELGWELSPTIAARLDELVDLIVIELRRWGADCTRRTSSAIAPALTC